MTHVITHVISVKRQWHKLIIPNPRAHYYFGNAAKYQRNQLTMRTRNIRTKKEVPCVSFVGAETLCSLRRAAHFKSKEILCFFK